MKLNSAPVANMTLTVTAKPEGVVMLNGMENTAAVVFNNGDWDEYKQVRVSSIDDDKDNPGDSRPVTITVDPGRLDGYDKVVPVSISATVIDDDTAELVFANADGVEISDDQLGQLLEGMTLTYKAKLRTQPLSEVRVDITSSNPKIATVPLSLTFQPSGDNIWSTYQEITVTSINDEVDNDGRSIRIKHVATGYDGVTAEKTVTIEDNDIAGLTVAKSASVTEGSSTYDTITVVLKSKPTGNVSVDVRSTDPKGVKVSKTKMGTPGTTILLSFTPTTWNSSQTVYVFGFNNGIEETYTRSVDISFTADGGGYRNIKGTSTVTVTSGGFDISGMNIDVSGITIEGRATIAEGGEGEYLVSLDDPPTRNVTVTVLSKDPKGAKVSKTKKGTPGTIILLSFTPTTWNSSQTVNVFGVDNNIAANRQVIITHNAATTGIATANATGEENIQVTVSNATDDAAGVTIDTSDLGSIRENGGRGTYTVKLNSEPTASVIVDVINKNPTFATVSTQSLTFTPGNWKYPKPVTVIGINNNVYSGSRMATIEHAIRGSGEYGPSASLKLDPVVVTVTDDDTAGFTVVPTVLTISRGREDTFTVKLNTEPTAAVSVTLDPDDTDVATVSPETLTFVPTNWDMPQEVVVNGEASSATHIGGERDTFITISSDTEAYVATPGHVDVTVTDEDVVVAPAGLTVTPTSLTISQGRTATYTVKLKTRPRGSVTVTAASSDTADATVSSGSRTFTPGNWDTAQEFTVTGVASSDSTATITNTASGSGYENVSASVSVAVRAHGLVLSKPAVTATEADMDTYTVALKTQPTGTVTVAVVSSDTAAATVSPASLTFTTSDWATAQPVTVTGVDDSTANAGGKRSTTITHDPAGGGYDAVATVSLPVTVNDIPAGLVLSKPAVTVTEADMDTYTVALKTQPTGTVTVAVVSSDTAAATVSPASLTFTTSDWATAQPVTVTGVDDSTANAADKRTVTILNRSSGAGYNATATVTVTVTDDDAAPELSIEGQGVPEGNTGTLTPLRFIVTKGGNTERVVRVDYEDARTGTATSGTDYTAVAADILTFAPAEMSKTITVMVQGDDESERDETIVIALRSPSDATFPRGQTTVMATGTIDDDDASRLSIEAEATSVDEGDPLIFTVSLEPPIDDEPVTVEVVTEGTATASADYTGVPEALTFAAGDAAKTITVAVTDDTDYELDETVVIALRNPRPPGDVVIEPGEAMAMATIEDNDNPPALSISRTSVAEGNAGTTSKLTFEVTKSGGTSMEATVAYADAGTGTATAGTDYTAVAAGTLAFAPNETSKTITVVVKGDDESEGDETVVIRLSSPSKATIAEDKGTATGTIIDDDTLPRVAIDWLARFGRTAAVATLDAIARRMNDGPAAAEPSLTVAGHRAAFAPGPVAQAAAGTAAPWEEGWSRALTLEELANGSSFDAGADFVEGLNVWGATSYNQFEMTPQGTYTMDGSLMSAILGVDHQGDTHVAGLALAYHGGDGEFGGIGKTEGSLGTNLYSVHPYARLTFGEAFHVGGSFGIGTGDLRITDKGGGALVETGVGMPVLAAVDARMELSLTEAWILALQADGHVVQMVADERPPRFTRVETNSHRLRLGVENSYVFLVTDGVSLAPVLETGLRYDGGDGETGVGFDVVVGLRLDATVAAGLMVDARGHASLNNWGEGQEQAPVLRDWGLGGVIRWRPAGGGMGPEMSLAPAYGGTLGAVAPILNAEIGYRLSAFGGVLTPYSAAEFGNGHQSYRAGAHFELGQGIALSAEGTHRQSATGATDQFLTLEMRLRQ